MTVDLLREEFVKRDYFWQKVQKEDGWKGGTLPVPFEGQYASSVSFGSLTDSTDIAEYDYVRGTITAPVELWASLLFNHSDLQEHNGKIPETSFLKILPGQVERFMGYVKEVTSQALLTGPHFAKAVADTDLANGVIEVDKIDRFTKDQKVSLDDDNSSATSYYVIAISIDASTVTLSATRDGAAANISAYTTAQNAKFYHPGAQAAPFTSLRNALLSSANGGGSSIHGVTKTTWPHLQAVNKSGSDITASNILDKLFDFYTDVRRKAKGNANTFLMSFKHLGSVMKQIQLEKGAFHVTKQPKASQYGWTEIEITSVQGSLTVVGIQEMDDDVIFAVDWNSFKFCSNGMFKKRMSPDGTEYFEVRATTGFSYIVDISLFGEMMYMIPGHNGVLYSISY